MTKDRIKDLQKNNPWPRVSYIKLSRQYLNHDGQNTVNDSNAQFTTINVDNEHHVAEFLAQIDLIRLLIDKIEELAKDVAEIHKKMLEPMPDPKLRQELDDKTDDIKKLAYDISTKLKKMEQVQENQDAIEKASAQWRIKESQIFNMTRRFRELMNQYNLESDAHRERCKKVIMRELEITGNRKTNDEVEEMLENGFPGTFNFSIMVDIEKAKQAATEIEERHRDITNLETSIKELHGMFLDLAILVTTQGEMIDNIEHNVLQARDDVGHAAVEVYEANKSKEKATKKKFCICIILIAVVVILILIIATYITVQKKIIGR